MFPGSQVVFPEVGEENTHRSPHGKRLLLNVDKNIKIVCVSDVGKSVVFSEEFGFVIGEKQTNMEDVNVIKLPVTEERAPAKKRTLPLKSDPEKEDRKRQRNARKVAVLGEEDSSVKLLEELVFGAEDELVERLVEVSSTRLRSKICKFNVLLFLG